MKNRQKPRETLHKISTYLRSKTGTYTGTTPVRKTKRFVEGRTKQVPSSTKVGKDPHVYRQRTNNLFIGRKGCCKKVEKVEA
jgi:hypothetical protein